jgi:NAD(P)-dependent dehydrogenase (short-subunit alcohol dehydrogenase family)
VPVNFGEEPALGDLDNKTAVITGGTDGLGLAIARAFIEAGAQVVVSGRDVERSKRASEQLGETFTWVQGDATDREDVERLLKTALARGGVDILVNNVGANIGNALGPFVDVTAQSWEATFATNVHSAFLITQRVLPKMTDQGWGRILMMSSVEGKEGRAGMVTYAATKHALGGMVKALAHEVGPTV